MAMLGWTALLCILLVTFAGCKGNKSMVRVPVAEPPRIAQQGPATEQENQSTSMPIMVETLPQPTPSGTEVLPSIPPPLMPPPPPRPKAPLESHREAKALPAPEAASTPPGVPGIQLAPQISPDEMASMINAIKEQLESARARMKSINGAILSNFQKANLATVQDFVKKSEESQKRGDYQQSLVLARKANTLAGSLLSEP